MSRFSARAPLAPALPGHSALSLRKPREVPPPRSAPFDQEPGFYEDGGVWLYGNARALKAKLAFVASACGRHERTPSQLDAISAEAMRIVLSSNVLVGGIQNVAHQRAAVVPLRMGIAQDYWFSPVVSNTTSGRILTENLLGQHGSGDAAGIH